MRRKRNILTLPPETEDHFLGKVLDLAKCYGWRTAHFRPARTATGWRTAVQGDGKGFPDLILAKAPRLIIAELKAESGETTPEQDAWLELFRATDLPVYLWRPSDWNEIVALLSAR